MENKALIIVDPQIDFISGTLPVPGAEQAMDNLADYLKKNGSDYSNIIITADRHPLEHCSFIQNGGKWPRHCVSDSVGAAIWPPIMEVLYSYSGHLSIFHKGENPRYEEYSIFKNSDAAEAIAEIVKSEKLTRIDICGLAGDVCVANTLLDAIKKLGWVKFKVLTEFSPSLDGGIALGSIISSNNIARD